MPSEVKPIKEQINKLKGDDILPLICAAAALRKEDYLRIFFQRAESIRLNDTELYESLLQNYLFTGYPSALIALKVFKEYFPKPKNIQSEDWDLTRYLERGTKNCKRIYGTKFNKLISNVKEFSPELSEWLVLEGYGKVMGRKGLSFKKKELNVISVLTVLKFEDQLYSHINGAFRMKASKDQIERVINNLNIFRNNEMSNFGMNVLNRYLKEEGIG